MTEPLRCVRHSVKCIPGIVSAVSQPYNNPVRDTPFIIPTSWRTELGLSHGKELVQIREFSEQKNKTKLGVKSGPRLPLMSAVRGFKAGFLPCSRPVSPTPHTPVALVLVIMSYAK